ncbi:protein dj-1beta isoform X1 [Pieris rapae]|uniref:protein dj-1beta isoform X1 n=2 Tax=Pieris rapae TaxID=64459 RepID=UPI001E27B260|nr:protein dj-1beta isoform X1 [Pieris rapae]
MFILSAPRNFASNLKFVNLLLPKSRKNPVKSSQTVRNLKISKMSKSALVIIAQGAEEMETVITVDMLRRAGVSVTMAGLDGNSPVLCSRQVTLVPDKSLADALAEKPQYDAVILPGGLEGSDRLSKSDVVGTLLKEHEGSGKIIAAICAAPTAFVAHGVGKGKKITSYPTTKDKITSDYTYIEGERVVIDGNFVTSRGPGTAYWFGLSLIELLTGKEKAAQVEKGMIITGY